MGNLRDNFHVRVMSGADKAVWSDMRFDLWDRLSIDEHLVDIANMLNSDKPFGYIALTGDDQPAGFAEVSIRDYANGCLRQPVPFLEGIRVKPHYRRQSVGRCLLQTISDELAAHGYTELCSDSDIGDHDAHDAHAAWGFEETERVVYFRIELQDRA